MDDLEVSGFSPNPTPTPTATPKNSTPSIGVNRTTAVATGAPSDGTRPPTYAAPPALEATLAATQLLATQANNSAPATPASVQPAKRGIETTIAEEAADSVFMHLQGTEALTTQGSPVRQKSVAPTNSPEGAEENVESI
jgi:hypothetical protein